MLRGWMVGAAALGAMVSVGCSDPAAPPPVGGAYFEISAVSPTVSGKQCPHTGAPGITIGSVPPSGSDKGHPLTDEENGASVECSVSGGKFKGYVQKNAFSVRVNGEIDTATGKGTMSFAAYDPNALTTLTTKDTMCDVTVVEPMKIGGETAWAQFSCPALESPSQPSALCAAPVGWFYFDKCN
jgi:hypothetical protein